MKVLLYLFICNIFRRLKRRGEEEHYVWINQICGNTFLSLLIQQKIVPRFHSLSPMVSNLWKMYKILVRLFNSLFINKKNVFILIRINSTYNNKNFHHHKNYRSDLDILKTGFMLV